MSTLADLAVEGVVERDVPLAPLTTYRFGGPARYLLEAHDEEEVLRVAEALAREPVPVLVLGRGSNLVVSPEGFAGLVIRPGAGLGGVAVRGDGRVVAGAAASQPAVARRSAASERGGLEYMVGIPGSVGGAVRTNSGCHGTDTAEWLVSARVVDLVTGEVRDRGAGELGLAYRHSNLADTDMVVAATFRTVARPRPEAEAIMREITRWRREHQPGGTLNAGSVFKNPPGDAAGRLIDALGLKGLRVGGVAVSERHANFFVADAGASAQDLYDLVAEVRRRVWEAAGVALEPEVCFVGRFGERS
ncbi:MAG TPA: UDP-N-acetylmuramate dehydrogenase [Acidimicrobiia bacterium]|nr:UDP-N-acetylmuramate dehydrogenase [Acidimicrobiia bacterium]